MLLVIEKPNGSQEWQHSKVRCLEGTAIAYRRRQRSISKQLQAWPNYWTKCGGWDESMLQLGRFIRIPRQDSQERFDWPKRTSIIRNVAVPDQKHRPSKYRLNHRSIWRWKEFLYCLGKDWRKKFIWVASWVEGI